MNRFPIFMYHALWPALASAAERARYAAADPQLANPDAGRYALERATFEAHLAALDAAGAVSPGNWSEVASPPAGGAGAAWLTFDDGHRTNLEVALPLLEAHGRRAIFFITTDWIGTPGFMDVAGLRRLHAAGMLIGAHGCSHRLFSELSAAELRREMADSKRRLEDVLGVAVPAMAQPGGRGHPAQREVAREVGYEHIFTSEAALARTDGDRLAWPRIALLRRTPIDLVARLLAGDEGPLRAVARGDRLRRLARRLMGESFYRVLRRRLLGR